MSLIDGTGAAKETAFDAMTPVAAVPTETMTELEGPVGSVAGSGTMTTMRVSE